MDGLKPSPGLSDCDGFRERGGRRLFGPALLAAGIVLGALYATPDAYNPLVQVGVIVVPGDVDDAPIVMIAPTIPVRASDLPTQRPSLSAARAIDQVEAAHFVGTIPSAAAAVVDMDDDAPDKGAAPAAAGPTAAALPAAKAPVAPAPVQTATSKKPVGISGPDEDFDALKTRVFTPER